MSSQAAVFRYDINGLRAYAVLAVLLFHFNLFGVNAGFIGVDLFFVISGYLMTSIVVRGLEKNNFSFGNFYLSRLRRIVPALLVLISVFTIFAWFYLTTPALKKFSKEAFSAALFYSNISYGFEGSYFSQPFGKWFLHTWTLGLEMQFYLLYPVFLTLMWRIFSNEVTLISAVLALFIGSFILCLIVASWKPTIAFYLLPTRTWEFVGGGVVFFASRHFIPTKSVSRWLNLSGFLIFFAALFLIDNGAAWPSVWALFPVTSAMLIIFAAQQDSKLTNNAICQWLGNISYSVYLWHWPIVVLLHYLELQGNILAVLVGVSGSLILGHISYVLVENPLRSGLAKQSNTKQLLLIVLPVVCLSIFMLYSKANTFEGRINPTVDRLAQASENYRANRNACQPNISGLNSPGCVFGRANGKTLAYLVGDSHADMVASAVGAAATNQGGNIKFYGRMGCPTVKGALIKASSRTACFNFNNWLFEFLAKDKSLTPVVIVNSIWMSENGGEIGFSEFDETEHIQEVFKQKTIESLCEIANKRPVYVSLPMPNARSKGPEDLAKQLLLGKLSESELGAITTSFDEELERSKYMREVYSLASSQCPVKLLDPLPYFCSGDACEIMQNGEHFYYDGGHLNEFGNKKLVPMFENIFSEGFDG